MVNTLLLVIALLSITYLFIALMYVLSLMHKEKNTIKKSKTRKTGKVKAEKKKPVGLAKLIKPKNLKR